MINRTLYEEVFTIQIKDYLTFHAENYTLWLHPGRSWLGKTPTETTRWVAEVGALTDLLGVSSLFARQVKFPVQKGCQLIVFGAPRAVT